MMRPGGAGRKGPSWRAMNAMLPRDRVLETDRSGARLGRGARGVDPALQPARPALGQLRAPDPHGFGQATVRHPVQVSPVRVAVLQLGFDGLIITDKLCFVRRGWVRMGRRWQPASPIRVPHRDCFLCRAISEEHAGATVTLKDIEAAWAAHVAWPCEQASASGSRAWQTSCQSPVAPSRRRPSQRGPGHAPAPGCASTRTTTDGRCNGCRARRRLHRHQGTQAQRLRSPPCAGTAPSACASDPPAWARRSRRAASPTGTWPSP